MRPSWRRTLTLAAIVIASAALLPSAASAHPEHDQTGFAGGLAHPLLGLDHLAAMAAIGLIAARFGGSSWIAPFAFVAFAAVGAISGLAQPSALIEVAVALSVIGIGAWLFLGQRLPLITTGVIAGGAGFLHGWAHGGELPAQASSLWFLGGALITTALLHAAGMGAGLSLGKLSPAQQQIGWRATGGAVVAAGLAALVG